MSVPELHSFILEFLSKEIHAVGAPNMLKHIASYVEALPDIEDTPLEDSFLICVRNGVYNLRTNRLSPHDPRYFFTCRIEANIRPDIALTCPVFDNFLNVITGCNQELIARIWKMMGYLLTSDTKAKKFFILQGVGNSGKSVLGNLISSLINKESVCNSSIFQFEGQFATSLLQQKRLNISMDLPNKRMNAQAMGIVKMITGQDSIMVEEKYKAATSYKGNCKLVFGSNHPLNFDTSDEAFASRIVLIPFGNAVPKQAQDPNLLQKLESEKSAIVVRALHAYCGLVANGYQFAGEDNFTVYHPGNFTTISDKDILRKFVDGECTFEVSTFTTTRSLYEAYQVFCRKNGYSVVGDCASFSRLLNSCCDGTIIGDKQRLNGRPQNGYRGVALR